jgi:hypothetical protein
METSTVYRLPFRKAVRAREYPRYLKDVLAG